MARTRLSRDHFRQGLTLFLESGNLIADINRSDEEKFDHPTQKPVELTKKSILNHTRRGELVYGPFLGSGTTLAAAESTQRVCYGLELDPKFMDLIVQRWQGMSGKKAVLNGDGRTFEEIRAERVEVAA